MLSKVISQEGQVSYGQNRGEFGVYECFIKFLTDTWRVTSDSGPPKWDNTFLGQILFANFNVYDDRVSVWLEICTVPK